MSGAPKIRTCRTCVAWLKTREINRDGVRHKGECHMNPPLRSRNENFTPDPVWIETADKDWCMQWAEDRERVVERIKEVMVEDAK
jgi:hypothetical protein